MRDALGVYLSLKPEGHKMRDALGVYLSLKPEGHKFIDLNVKIVYIIILHKEFT